MATGWQRCVSTKRQQEKKYSLWGYKWRSPSANLVLPEPQGLPDLSHRAGWRRPGRKNATNEPPVHISLRRYRQPITRMESHRFVYAGAQRRGSDEFRDTGGAK